MTDFAARIAAIATEALGAEPASASRIEQALRAQLGGQKVRIDERPPITVALIDAGLRQGKPIRAIAQELGVHRGTLYRHISRKPAKRCNTEPA